MPNLRDADESRAPTTFSFTARLWEADVDAAWHFVTLPHDVSDEIEATAPGADVGFGSVRVRVTVGTTTWDTSLFPSRERQAYDLPVKKAVRQREGLAAGAEVDVRLEVAT